MKNESTRYLITVCMVGLLACLASPAWSAASGEPDGQDAAQAVTERPRAEPELEVVTQEDRQEVEPAAAADTELRLFENPADLFGTTPAPASCCIDECRKDKDCDGVCGAPGAGACIRVNSCCRECFCTF